MRSAAIIDKLDHGTVAIMNPPNVYAHRFGYMVDFINHSADAAQVVLERYYSKVPKATVTNVYWIGTLGVGPHTDMVVGDVTIGVVVYGEHKLFTGKGRAVGELRPGVVYVLDNKKLHGAFPLVTNTPLIVAAADVVCSYRDAYLALVRNTHERPTARLSAKN